jgi:hypothetical protein
LGNYFPISETEFQITFSIAAAARATLCLTVMKTMNLILIAVYAIAAGLVLLGGVVYP